MTAYSAILVDASVLVAFYNAKDRYHSQVKDFFATCHSRLITVMPCVTEVMWLLSSDRQIQNLFLFHLRQQVYECEPLLIEDFTRIAELNTQYADLPGDFADLSLVVISERLNIAAIATLDKDFNIYRRYQTRPFDRVFLPQ